LGSTRTPDSEARDRILRGHCGGHQRLAAFDFRTLNSGFRPLHDDPVKTVTEMDAKDPASSSKFHNELCSALI